jgi:hypothetical protein
MSFDDVANRMQERHANHMVPFHAVDDTFAQSLMDSERRSRRNSDLVIGALLLGLGLIVTLATYSSASQSGGTYVVAYGPMIFGAIRIFRGLAS